ncbi:MAG: MFS transporter [Gemmatimonadales bacterium]|nr:MFS transporter [Gemmatimonadales bacterium]
MLRPDGDFEVTRSASRLERWSWALYDFANTIFSMNIVTLYFSVWVVTDLGAGTGGYAVASSVSSLLVALSIPFLGVLSDERRRRKLWVVWFTLLCVASTALLGVVGEGAGPASGVLLPALAIFVVANYAYQGALPFYNAMLPELVPAAEHGRLSGFGTALGYVGSIAGMFFIAPFFNGAFPVLGPLPEGALQVLRLVPFTEEPGRAATFVPTALAFLLFSLPLFVVCRDHVPVPRAAWPPTTRARPFRQVARALVDTRRHPGLLRLLLASLFYHDAIGTVIGFMAVYTVVVMGFREGSEVTLFVVLTIPSIIGAAVIGWLCDRHGPKRTLLGVLVGWTALLVAVIAVQGQAQFWLVGAMVGFVFGGIWTAERPLLLSLVPDAEAGRYFGLLVLSARTAAVVGPLGWALIVEVLLGARSPQLSYRVAIGTLVVFMAIAAWLVAGVPDRRSAPSPPEP